MHGVVGIAPALCEQLHRIRPPIRQAPDESDAGATKHTHSSAVTSRDRGGKHDAQRPGFWELPGTTCWDTPGYLEPSGHPPIRARFAERRACLFNRSCNTSDETDAPRGTAATVGHNHLQCLAFVYRKYQRTQRTMITSSKCRPRNSAGHFHYHPCLPLRVRVMIKPYQIQSLALATQPSLQLAAQVAVPRLLPNSYKRRNRNDADY